MHPISSQDESWFPVSDWRVDSTFHKHFKRSFPSSEEMWEGPCVFCLKWNGPREALTQKKAGFPCSGWNSGSSFISQNEGMSESPVKTLEKAAGFHFIWTGASHTSDPSRGTQNSMIHKVTMPDSSWKWIGIPISLCQLESETRSPTSPLEASVLLCQAEFILLRCPS